MKKTSPGYTQVSNIFHYGDHNSYQRLNPDIRSSLMIAISCGLEFHENDFNLMAQNTRMSRWIGEDGIEWAYALACGSERGSENPSAVKAIEKYRGRKPFLWAERTSKAERLYVGARFTWQGHAVEVTSMDGDKLIACSYTGYEEDDGFSEGAIQHFDRYRKIEYAKNTTEGGMILRLSPECEGRTRSIKRRFTITHEQLAAVRKEFDDRRKAIIKTFTLAKTLEELDVAKDNFHKSGTADVVYRHFDLEIIKEKYSERRQEIKDAMTPEQRGAYEVEFDRQQQQREAADLARWIAGEDVHRHFDDIRLRIKGEWVECSNGNRVTLDAARATLAFVIARRKKGWFAEEARCQSAGQGNPSVSFGVDAFELTSISESGVQIGCTLIPWKEVARFRCLLQGHDQAAHLEKKFPANSDRLAAQRA